MPNEEHMYQELAKFANDLKSESDRAVVVLAAAKLDLLLYQILSKVLKPTPGKTDGLLDGESPLGTFSARIMMCHRLGLIDDAFARALNILRKIRNSFAHEPSGVSLDSGQHRDRVKELVMPFNEHGALRWVQEQYFKDTQTSLSFRATVALLYARLEGLYLNATSVVCNNPYKVLPSGWNDGGNSKHGLAPPPSTLP